jgi:hypothetical protein
MSITLYDANDQNIADLYHMFGNTKHNDKDKDMKIICGGWMTKLSNSYAQRNGNFNIVFRGKDEKVLIMAAKESIKRDGSHRNGRIAKQILESVGESWSV